MTETEKMLKELIRPVTEEDKKKLPMYSYSRLEVYKNCPLQFKFKYIDNYTTSETTLPLELGSLCHRVLEEKCRYKIAKKDIDYSKLYDMIVAGVHIKDAKTREDLRGTKDLATAYFTEWYERDNASGQTYAQKMGTFTDRVLKTEMEEKDWYPVDAEHYFEFVWDNRVIFHGFIDRVDQNAAGDYRVIDYKTSKKSYGAEKLRTSWQFGIYALAILNEFGKLPVDYIYRFILIDETQHALTKGWEKRLVKQLTQVFNDIQNHKKDQDFCPKTSPLCYWCSYCRTNPSAKGYRNLCDYYSLWTPTNRSFKVNKEWKGPEAYGTARKLWF